jgi:hypothetical protein
MAGNYPDPSTWRMALDRDGSTFTVGLNAGPISTISATDIQNANDETQATAAAAYGTQVDFFAVVFPEKRDIDGFFFNALVGGGGSGATVDVQTSTNTTNGQDGTWTAFVSAYNYKAVAPVWRSSVVAGTALAVKGIRWVGFSAGNTFAIRALHLYGEIAPGENPDRLVFWSATADEKMPPATLDWGDVPRSSSADRIVRVKNISGTHTANNVRVSFDILTDGTPSVPAQHLVSYGGGAFLAQVNLGSLGPGAISGPITLRRVTPSNAVLGLFAPRASAVADSWT